MNEAERIAKRKLPVAVIDTENGFVKLGLAKNLAKMDISDFRRGQAVRGQPTPGVAEDEPVKRKQKAVREGNFPFADSFFAKHNMYAVLKRKQALLSSRYE